MALVVICSLVRDGMAYIPAYRRQLESLSISEGDSWHLCILEGDSSDGTWEYLVKWAAEDSRVTLGKENVGDATEIEDRASRWARVGNSCIDLIPNDINYSHMLWLESDLCFPPELLKRLLQHNVDIVAPVIWLGGLFYDTWGFRDLSGRRWTNEPPYHPEYRPMHLMEMGSVGSCVLFRRAILDAGVRFKGTYENGLLVGMSNDARALGYKVFADTATAILHPVEFWEAQMWQPSELVIKEDNGISYVVPLEEARQMGLEYNCPVLDSDAMLGAQRAFFHSLFSKYRTNRMRVQIEAQVLPRRQYRMAVHIETPFLPGLYNNLRAKKILPDFLFRKLIRKYRHCSLVIKLD